ncbi:unnamed protein product [Trichobilharzia regenti]|nr:unnamed protein product [Trichobilharzia regenti]
MNCTERPDGYDFTYMPLSPGEYMISIKYGDAQHIIGSPFKVSSYLNCINIKCASFNNYRPS